MFQEMRKIPKTIILCILAEILNFLTVYIFYLALNIPLFFDTIWTVAVVFYLGLVPYNKPKIWTKNSKNSEFAVL